MESIGVLAAEGEWNSFNGVLSNGEADFMVQLLGTHSFSSEEDEYPSLLENISSTYFPNHELTNNTNEMTSFDENSYFCSNIVNPSFQTFSQESSYSNGNNVDNPYMQTLSHENYYLNNYITPMMNDGSSLSMDYLIVPDEGNVRLSAKVFPEDVIEEANNTCSNEEMKNESFIETSSFEPHDDHVVLHQDHKFQPKRKSPHEMTNPDSSIEEKHIESPKKKTRVTEAVGKKKRVVQSKKKPKQSSTNSTNNDDEDRQSSSSENSSGEESNNSQEQNEDPNSKVTLNSNGKTRASRGSATDPQSLYARKRREKINERLRILQNLVPNGTKVDISTMLEEAVEYVKFLQLQIKLLSSDDLWMYSPIAYNGMNIDALDHMKMNISSMQRH